MNPGDPTTPRGGATRPDPQEKADVEILRQGRVVRVPAREAARASAAKARPSTKRTALDLVLGAVLGLGTFVLARILYRGGFSTRSGSAYFSTPDLTGAGWAIFWLYGAGVVAGAVWKRRWAILAGFITGLLLFIFVLMTTCGAVLQ